MIGTVKLSRPKGVISSIIVITRAIKMIQNITTGETIGTKKTKTKKVIAKNDKHPNIVLSNFSILYRLPQK